MKKNNFLRNLYITIVFIFLFLPIAIVILFSFNTSKLNILFEGFTFKWYIELFKNTALLDAFKNTIIVTLTSTIASTVIGTLSAFALKKYDFFGKKLVNELLYIPIVIPEIVLGIALLSIYTLLKIELGIGTLILSHISFSLPFVIISVRAVLDNMPPNIEDAANDLGASNTQTLWNVVIPTIMPGITSGALLAFTLSLDDVIISYFTSGPGSNTLPLQVFSIIKTGITPDVNALATLILLVVLLGLSVSTIIQIRNIKKLKVSD